MKNIIKSSIFFFVLFLLIVLNGYFFFLSIKLGDEIALYEEKIEKLHHENINFEKELSDLNSLEYAKKIATKMNFLKNTDNIYFLENLKYALAVKE